MFTYDAFGRVTRTSFPSTLIETYAYDADNNLTNKKDRKNQTSTYTYDQLNRLTQKAYPDSTTVNYTSHPSFQDSGLKKCDSRLTQVTDPTGTYSFTFDNMGRVTQDEEIAVLLKSICFLVVDFYLCLCVPMAVGAPPGDACDLPKDLRSEVATKYPGKKVVTLADLQDDDRGFFQKDHSDSCPGLVRVDFYGDGKATLAMVLIGKGEGKDGAILVVAHKVEAGWKTRMLAAGGPNVPVVWSQDPGEYQDVYGEKKIRAERPVIVFCEYESWAILYAWTGTRTTKIWLMD